MTSRPYRVGKRAFDITVASVLLAGASPVLAAAAVIVRLDSPGPAVYRATRVGRGGRVFSMYKLRTMVVDADDSPHRDLITALLAPGAADGVPGPPGGPGPDDVTVYKLQDDPRITRVGRYLRATSIDELPQLVNVLRGDMSLVGPRPDVPYSVEHYQPWQRQRLEVRPGMTGLWQVSGRGLVSPVAMLRLDVEYVTRRGALLDLQILGRTVPAVLRRIGAH